MASLTANGAPLRPLSSEAAAAAVAARAIQRLLDGLHIVRQALAQGGRASQDLLARRRDAQRVLAMARAYDNSQPGFASDLRCAAYRAMDEA